MLRIMPHAFIICLLMLQTAYAQVPVILSGPTPAIPSTFSVGDSYTYTYSLTNNVPKSLPITVSGIPSSASRVTVANDCGNNLPAGPTMCQIGINIAPQLQDLGTSINKTLSVNYQGRLPLTSGLAYSVVPSLALLTAVGQDSSSNAPLLAVSSDGGNTWMTQTVTDLTSNGYFGNTSCTGSGSTAICTAVGEDNTGNQPPLLVLSKNGGKTWATQSVPGLPTKGFFNAASCLGSGSSALCIAAGQDNTGTQPPLLVVSTNGGNTWTRASIAGLPTKGVFNGSGCTGTGSTAICTVVGQENPATGAPFLAVSTNGGNTWSVKSIPGLPTSGTFNAASCTGTGATALCIAAGQDDTGLNPPLLVVSKDGGNTWAIQTIAGLTSTGIFSGTSCVGSGVSAICSVAGSDDASNFPLLVVSNNGGTTWTVQSIIGLPVNYNFNAISCTGIGSTAICTAVGGSNETTTEPPFVVTSTNGGSTWSIASIPSLPSQGNFYSTSCTGTTSTAVCTAAGEDFTLSAPLLIVTTNGTNTWSTPSYITNFPDGGYFGATAATGGH